MYMIKAINARTHHVYFTHDIRERGRLVLTCNRYILARKFVDAFRGRQCSFIYEELEPFQCHRVVRECSDFCEEHQREGYEKRAIHNIDWGGERAAKALAERVLTQETKSK